MIGWFRLQNLQDSNCLEIAVMKHGFLTRRRIAPSVIVDISRMFEIILRNIQSAYDLQWHMRILSGALPHVPRQRGLYIVKEYLYDLTLMLMKTSVILPTVVDKNMSLQSSLMFVFISSSQSTRPVEQQCLPGRVGSRVRTGVIVKPQAC